MKFFFCFLSWNSYEYCFLYNAIQNVFKSSKAFFFSIKSYDSKHQLNILKNVQILSIYIHFCTNRYFYINSWNVFCININVCVNFKFEKLQFHVFINKSYQIKFFQNIFISMTLHDAFSKCNVFKIDYLYDDVQFIFIMKILTKHIIIFNSKNNYEFQNNMSLIANMKIKQFFVIIFNLIFIKFQFDNF